MYLHKILPPKLKIGDTIGVVAPSNPIIGDNIEELKEEIGQERRAKAKTSKKGNTPKNKKNINIEYSDEDFIFDEDE